MGSLRRKEPRSLRQQIALMQKLQAKFKDDVPLQSLPSEVATVEERPVDAEFRKQNGGEVPEYEHKLGWTPLWENFERTGDTMPKPSRPWKTYVDPSAIKKIAEAFSLDDNDTKALNAYVKLHEREHLSQDPNARHFDEEAWLDYLESLLQR